MGRRGSGRAGSAIGLVLAMLALSGCLGWPQEGFNPGNTLYDPAGPQVGRSSEVALEPRWEAHVPRALHSVVWQGRVHVLQDTDGGYARIWSYDAVDGDVLWSADMPAYSPGVTRVAVADFLYAQGDKVHASVTSISPCYCEPPYGIHSTSAIHGFDAATGAPAGVITELGPGLNRRPAHDPAVGNDLAAIPFGDDLRLISLRPGGEPARLLGPGNSAALDEAASRVYSTYGSTVSARSTACVDAACGVPVWTWDSPDGQDVGSPALDATGLYVVEWSTGAVHALDPADGTLLWSSPPLADGGSLSPDQAIAVRDGTVFVPGSGGPAVSAVAGCRPGPCRPRWQSSEQADARGALIAVSGNLVFVARPVGTGFDTEVTAYRAEGCGRRRCAALASTVVAGTARELIAPQGRVIVLTTDDVHVFTVDHEPSRGRP